MLFGRPNIYGNSLTAGHFAAEYTDGNFNGPFSNMKRWQASIAKSSGNLGAVITFDASLSSPLYKTILNDVKVNGLYSLVLIRAY